MPSLHATLIYGPVEKDQRFDENEIYAASTHFMKSNSLNAPHGAALAL